DEILLEAVEEEDDEADLFQSDIGRELEEKRIAKLPPVEEELKEEPVPEPVPAKVIGPKEEKKETVRKEAPTGKEAVELEEGVKQRGDKIVEIYEPWRIESPQHFAFQFKFAPYYPSKFKGADGHFQGIFDGGTGAWNEISLEWQPIDLLGILGIKGGTGYYVLVSHEKVDQKRLANSPILNFIPVQGALAYHLAYWHDQWVVPFGEVGGGFYYIFQNFARSPSKGKNYAAWKSGSYWGGGVQLLLDIFESDTAHVFDVDYGVNNSYLTLEYRRIEAREKKEYDFSGEFFMIGLHFDF
ncbi:MAG: hypothetical protein HY391_03695, partial [Deltaproteobacteria bacterium]|nr:hypothetical protein [Deltaproteobacteria bacterium]